MANATRPSDYRLGYRGDIEGLRAVAIMLVVADHAGVAWLEGGFVGVDVFFVLSGYLITGLLIQEINTTGSLRFGAFYARRIRRLMPALLLMLACVCFFCWLLIPSFAQLRQANAAGSAALWLSNIYFAFSNIGYFDSGAASNLFLHTWSLGVEEQFYLVWPLLLVLVAGTWEGARHPPGSDRAKIVMGLIFVTSLALCMWWSYQTPHLAFYMMPSRAWQFALGALVFLWLGAPNAPRDTGWMKIERRQELLRGIGWIGLTLVVVSALVINDNTTYPGAWALLPSLGAAAVIVAGTGSTREGVSGLLSLPPMQAIGRVSYGWYLWHWPVILLGATVLDMNSTVNRFGLVVLSLLIAALSYRLVEVPIRRSTRLIARPRLAVFASLALMVAANVMAISWHNAAREHTQLPAVARYQSARLDAPVIYAMGCDDWYHSAKVEICAFGPQLAKHTAVAIGDSVALQWFPAVARVFDKPDWRLLVITKSSCPMVDVPIFYERIGRVYTICKTWRERVLKTLALIRPDVVVMGSTFTYNFDEREWTQGTERILKGISDAADHVYMLRSTPILPFNGPQCLAPRSQLYNTLVGDDRCTAQINDPRFDKVYTWLTSAASHFDNVSTVDMTDAVCPHRVCRADSDGIIVFRDSQHMTATFAKTLAPTLAQRIDIPGDRSAKTSDLSTSLTN